MPFNADYRCGTWTIELNVNEIWGELENLLEKTYPDSIDEGSDFWLYVYQIENELNSCDIMPDFWEWFIIEGNYSNVKMWDTIKDKFVESE